MRREKTIMANYAILRVAKLTSFGNIAASGQHNFRERVTENADAERTHLNQLDGAQNTADLTKAISDLLPKKRRKDAVICIEYMISASPEHFGENWRQTENYGADYFKDAIEWLETRHGKENVVCKTVHLDESTPHLAAYVVPITADGRLAAKDFTGGRSVLAKMQTSFASEVGIKHGLIRGVERSNAVHQDNAKIAPMTAERLQLRKRVKVLEDEIDRLVKSAGAGGAALAAAQKALKQGEDELAVLSSKFLALEKKSEHQLKTNIQFNADINVLEAQAKVDAEAKTTAQSDLVKIQGELVKVQGALATAAATARAETTAKITAQGELVKVQGELVKAKSDYAGAKIIIGQANEYIKKLFDENKNMKKSLLDGSKLDAYTKDLQAQLVASNEKLALVLDEKAAALRALVESGEKSAVLLTTLAGHEAAADQLREMSGTREAQEAQEAFSDKWVGLREATKEEWQHLPLVDVSGQQAVYGISKGKFAIHTFKEGEVVPKLNLTGQQKNGVQR